MPADPTPDGGGILNKPVVKPFPQPTPGEEGMPEDGDDALANRDLEQPADTTRPPLGN